MACWIREYQIVGRKQPASEEETPQLYQMQIFAPNDQVAKSRFWHFMKKLKKIKKTGGEIVSFKRVTETNPAQAKTYGIWLRYDSKTGTHNMHKQYRGLTRVEAVQACYEDMASRHRARFHLVQIIRVQELENDSKVLRPYVSQWADPNVKFPLLHKAVRAYRPLYSKTRPDTFREIHIQ